MYSFIWLQNGRLYDGTVFTSLQCLHEDRIKAFGEVAFVLKLKQMWQCVWLAMIQHESTEGSPTSSLLPIPGAKRSKWVRRNSFYIHAVSHFLIDMLNFTENFMQWKSEENMAEIRWCITSLKKGRFRESRYLPDYQVKLPYFINPTY